MLLTALVRREILREVVFLWYTPLEVALLITEIAAFRFAFAASASFAATAASTFLIAVFTSDLIALFLMVLASAIRTLFFADLMLANLYTSKLSFTLI